jgi:pyrophosphatase PpaX
MIEACIFDIGGVLIKTDTAYLTAIRVSLSSNNLPLPPRSEIIKYLGISDPNLIRSVVGLVYRGDKVNSVYERCYTSFQSLFPEKILDELEVLPGVERCLQELSKRGIRLACQTGMKFGEASTILRHFNLLSYFPVIVTLDDVKNPRPDPEAIYLTLMRLGITDKSRCLYIGDTFTDIRFARNAGVKIACTTTGAQKRETLEKEKPDYIVDTITEILKLV